MRFHNRAPRPDRLYQVIIIHRTLLHDARVCIRICLPAAVYCAAILLLLQMLLLAAAVRHRVPGGKIYSRGSLHLIPALLSIHSNKMFFQCTPWQYCRIFSVGVFTYNSAYHTSSDITGMRGTKAGVTPPRRSPPCISS